MPKRTLVARSVQIAFSVAALAMALPTTVLAQSNAAGVAYGHVSPAANQYVVVENKSNGVVRRIAVESDGRWRAAGLPVGTYSVTLTQDGKTISSTDNVEVKVAQGSEVLFAGPTALDTVTVVGRVAQIDVQSATNSVVFTAKQLASLPVGHSMDAVIQLAPNTTAADPRIGGSVFAGSSASESAYYVNGFPVTNPLTQLGASELPWGAIDNMEVMTGGYGAEFGRSTGGVVNIVTKHGTNTWQGGVMASYSPQSLRSTPHDYYYPTTGYVANADTDGQLYRNRSTQKLDAYSASAYVGGPLIKDKLFMFIAAEQNNSEQSNGLGYVGGSPAGWNDTKYYNARYLGKLDWYLTPDQHIEATLIGDRYWDSSCGQPTFDPTTGAHSGDCVPTTATTNSGQGAATQILRYTGNLTDNLMVSAQIGLSKTPHSSTYAGIDGSTPQMSANITNQYPGITYANPYPTYAAGTTGTLPGASDKVKSGRADAEYTLGDHRLRAGLDYVSLESKNAGEGYLGGGIYVYSSTLNGALAPAANSTTTVSQAGALMSNGRYYYGRLQVYQTDADAASKQSAQYIEDVWQASKNLLVTPGLRFEQFKILNGDGAETIKISNQVNPRLQVAWDMNGNASTKIFGSLGRYGVQLPTSVALRGASASTYSQQYFTYTGVDAKGAPTGVTNINSSPYYVNNENGAAPDPRSVAAQNLRPNNQDEIAVGIEQAFANGLTGGAKLTYRRMESTIDDMCDSRPFAKYAANNGIDLPDDWSVGCVTFNPGRANTFQIDFLGTGNYTKVPLSASDLGFVKPKRTYLAADFYLEHALRNGWFGRVTYTYSKNKGNTEGQVMSDIGQTDIAATQAWDYPELMVGAYGNLPNDRRHQLKAYGFYQLTSEFDIGANLSIESGRPKNCIGNIPTTNPDAAMLGAYGSAYFYCSVLGSNGQVQTSGTDAGGNPIPVQVFGSRGSYGNMPWAKKVDLNFVYRPHQIKGLTARADIFNVFNSQTPTYTTETHETNGDATSISPNYGMVDGYTAPRSVKLTVSYEF